MKKPKIEKHPSTWRAFQRAADRWQKLSAEHRLVVNRLWAGTIASEFTGFELELLRSHGFLCPRDEQWLQALSVAQAPRP